MPRTRYVIETGTDTGGAWQPGGFHEAFNAADAATAKGSVRASLTQLGYAETGDTHVRLLDPDKAEIIRVPMDEAFWASEA